MTRVASGSPRTTDARFVGGLLALVATVAMGTAALLVCASALLFGWKPVVISSGSMGPRIRPGDIVLASPSSGERLRPGAVAVFRDPAGAGLVTHRIVEGDTGGGYRTKGDANRTPDSTPVAADEIVGVARLVVPFAGLPVLRWQEGRYLVVAGLLGAAVLVVHASQWGLLDPVAPGAVPPVRPGRVARKLRRRRAIRRGASIGLRVLVGASILALVSTAGASTMRGVAANPGNRWVWPAEPAPPAFPAFLLPDGPGDRTSVPVLPLGAVAPAVVALPNYDTDRDGAPGLVIARGGNNVNEADPARHQVWARVLPTETVVRGRVRLHLWSAISGYANVRGALAAYLQDCDQDGAGCATVATASIEAQRWHDGAPNRWVERTLDFGVIDRTLAAGRQLRVKVVVPNRSQGDMWLAYGTVDQPSRLTVD